MPKPLKLATVQTAETARTEIAIQGTFGPAQSARIEERMHAGQLAFTRLIGQLEGREQQAALARKITDVSWIMAIAEIKKSNIYKGLRHPGPDGNPLTVRNWQDFCEVVIGRSVSQVDEDLANFKALGEALMGAFLRMGISARQMREMRCLPDAELALISEAAKTGSVDQVKQVAEDAIERLHQDREEAEERHKKERRILEKDIEVKSRRGKDIASQLEAAKDALENRQMLSQDESEAAQLSELRTDGLAADLALRRLAASADRVLSGTSTDVSQLAARQAVEYIAQVLEGLITHLGIPVDFKRMVNSPWGQAADFKSNATTGA